MKRRPMDYQVGQLVLKLVPTADKMDQRAEGPYPSQRSCQRQRHYLPHERPIGTPQHSSYQALQDFRLLPLLEESVRSTFRLQRRSTL